MPRPGPRPYECIRRAWHSDRHQPMRGSLIREIFRIVNEFHSTATRKNKEWQEKLPIVVLKAEEIMYSKANSEAEYMDLKTLWDRTNDAVSTIIRRDESTESGNLLQPCIEAALNLGCTPRRASRSQRHNNSRCYLSSSTQETVNETSVAPKISRDLNHEGSSSFPPPHSINPICNPRFMSYYSNLAPRAALNSHQLGSESCSPLVQERPESREHPFLLTMPARVFPFCSEDSIPVTRDNSSFSIEGYPLPSSDRLYSLYHSPQQQMATPQFAFQNLQDSNPNPNPLIEEKRSLYHKLISCNKAVDTSNTTIQAPSNIDAVSENLTNSRYDLSLRLGPSPGPCSSAENSWAYEAEDLGSSNSHDGNKICDFSPSKIGVNSLGCSSPSQQKDKGFCFFPLSTSDDPLESSSSKWSSEGEGLEGSTRKRKAPMNSSVKSGHFSSRAKPLTGQCSDVTKRVHF